MVCNPILSARHSRSPDYPGKSPFNPKECEQTHQYGQSNYKHNHIKLTPLSNIPRPWCNYLEHRNGNEQLLKHLLHKLSYLLVNS